MTTYDTEVGDRRTELAKRDAVISELRRRLAGIAADGACRDAKAALLSALVSAALFVALAASRDQTR